MILKQILPLRWGRNVEFHYYDRPFFLERQNCLFSSSLLRHQNVKSVFLVHHYIEKEKYHNVDNQNINYLWHITYGYQGLWGPGGLG